MLLSFLQERKKRHIFHLMENMSYINARACMYTCMCFWCLLVVKVNTLCVNGCHFVLKAWNSWNALNLIETALCSLVIADRGSKIEPERSKNPKIDGIWKIRTFLAKVVYYPDNVLFGTFWSQFVGNLHSKFIKFVDFGFLRKKWKNTAS